QGTLGAAYENLTSTNPETATGLTPQTTYDYFVRANCGIDGFSSWAGPYTFTTLCDAVVAPYSEDFELGFTPTTSGFPGAADAFSIENCYTAVNTNYFWVMAPGTLTASGGTGPDVSITTGNYFYAEGSSGTTGAIAELVTPLFDSSALTLPSVGFDYHMAGADMGSLEVLVRSGATDTVVATLTGPQQAADTDSYVNLNIALNAFAGQSFQIVFRATRGTGFTSDIAIDNLTIDESPSCPSPLGLTVDSAATDTITLSWVNGGSETAWEIEYVVAGAAQGTGTVVPASVNPFTITSLTANTSYEFYLRAVCAVGDESIWLGPTAGRTDCVAFAVPFTEGFNSTSATQDCWTVLDANGDGDQWTLDYAFNSSEGDQVAAISTDFNAGNDDDYLISPAISLTGIDRLRYEYRVQSVGEPNEMEVLISTTGNSAADFTTTLLPVTLYSNITYVEEVIDLSAYTGDVYVAWRIPPTSTDGWRMYIDNVRFEVIPGCDEPIALTTSGATTTSIDITFTERGTATAWEVEYGTSGFVLGSGTNVSAPSNPFTLTGLIPGSCYDYYIRSSCPSGGFSPWSPVSNFCTLCLAFDVPFQEGFNSTSTTQQCWTVLDVNADGDEWNLDYVTSPFEGDQSANINTDFNGGVDNDYLISPQINLTAAGQRLKYHFRVQSANEPNNMEILLSTTGIDPADFSNVLLPVTAYANTTYQEQIINLSAFTGPVFIAWRIPPTALDGWRVYIDDVIVEDNPSCVQPDMLAADTVTTTTANFSWNETGTATVWNVEVQPVGVAQGTAGAIYQNLTATSPEGITGLISNTSYDFYVRSDCGNGGVSVFSGPLTVTTAAACGDVVYDTGGSTGDYQNNESYTITYTPDTIANVATLDFTLVDVEGCCDTIKIYDGSDITAPVLESDLESPASFTASNLDGAITVQFTSDGSVVGAGWVANFTCIPRPSCINVTALTLDNTTADTLTVSWTDNNVPTSTDWEVVAVPTGDPAPAIGMSNVTVIPFTITG
ncbi:MAG: choice-of-anchor J domain-containing protein, partial [Nonlabens sp.]|uniref:choice-of-anchor J domain-containing protein n=1 Tax=Nonlabens sp. TaxID=1888209 RepID=UPI0035A67AAC